MDPNSSLGKICLGENIVEIFSDRVEGSGDWNSLEFQDTANSGQMKETKAMVFYQMDTEEVSDRFVAPCFVNRMEAYDGEINIGVEENKISNEYAVQLCLKHEVKRGNKLVKKELIVALRDKVELDGKIVKEEEEAVKRIKGASLKEKDNPRAFIFPIRLEGQVNKNALADTGSDINTMPYRIYKQLGKKDIKKVDRGITMINHTQRLFLTFDGFCHQTFRAARSDVMRNAESDSDDEEEYQIKRNKFGAPIYGLKPAPYLKCNDPAERSLQEHTTEKPDCQDPNTQDNTKQWKKYYFHNFTMSFFYGKVVAEKKIIKFRLGGLRNDDNFNAQDYWLSISREDNLGLSRSHTSTIRNPILRVIHKMITYGLCQRTTRYDKIQKNDLWLLSMFDARHQNGYANIAWVIAKWMKRKGARTQKESQICCGQFISKLARKCKVLTEDVVRSLSTPIYCRDLDTITLRDLIGSEGKLILEDPQPGVPRVGISRPLRASMQDLYDKMGRMKIRQDGIERMEYRQSYHWDRYHGVFQHMAGVYSVLLQGAYNPPGYAQP
ncbi:hypothetical protein Tco_1274768 [Tanacetum coccineum]